MWLRLWWLVAIVVGTVAAQRTWPQHFTALAIIGIVLVVIQLFELLRYRVVEVLQELEDEAKERQEEDDLEELFRLEGDNRPLSRYAR